MATKDKVAFITGANKGIGLETARGLGELGIAVVIGSRDEANGRAAADKLQAEGIKNVEAVRFDVTKPEDHQAIARHPRGALRQARHPGQQRGRHAGEGRLRANGGFNTTLDGDARGPAARRSRRTSSPSSALTQTLLPLIRKAPAGRIVNLSSILGSLTLHSDPKSPIYDMKAFAYDASKTALNAFTVHLAHELRGTPIKVNSAHPGWVKTDMGGPAAPMEVSEGGKTSVQLATLPDDGPTGGYFHLGEPLPW